METSKDKEYIWNVLWIPNACGGFVVARGLRKQEADSVAARHEALAKERSWAGRAEVCVDCQ
jgi:hypothetical protein